MPNKNKCCICEKIIPYGEKFYMVSVSDITLRPEWPEMQESITYEVVSSGPIDIIRNFCQECKDKDLWLIKFIEKFGR